MMKRASISFWLVGSVAACAPSAPVVDADNTPVVRPESSAAGTSEEDVAVDGLLDGGAALSSLPVRSTDDGATFDPTLRTRLAPQHAAKPAPQPTEVDRIEFRFQDASVPPPHHRSYTITVTKTKVRKVVDSYGDVISDKETPLAAGKFEALVAALEKVKLGPEKGSAKPGCTGGTSRHLRAFAGSKVKLQASSSKCGGQESGTLTSAEAIVKEVHGLAPSALP